MRVGVRYLWNQNHCGVLERLEVLEEVEGLGEELAVGNLLVLVLEVVALRPVVGLPAVGLRQTYLELLGKVPFAGVATLAPLGVSCLC